MATTGGARGWRSLDELFQFAEQFPILVELWALDARIPRNTRQAATQVVRIMQIKLVRLACPSTEAPRQMSRWVCSSILEERRRILLTVISLSVLRIRPVFIGI